MAEATKANGFNTELDEKIEHMKGQSRRVDIAAVIRSTMKNPSNQEGLIKIAVWSLGNPEHVRAFYNSYVGEISRGTRRWQAVRQANKRISPILDAYSEQARNMMRELPRDAWLECMKDAELGERLRR